MTKQEFESSTIVALAQELGLDPKVQQNESTVAKHIREAFGQDAQVMTRLEAIVSVIDTTKEDPVPKMTLEEYKESLQGKTADKSPEAVKRSLEQRKKQEVINKATSFVRCQVVCYNPSKKDWTGEIISAANDVVKQEKFVQFNAPTHLPRIIVNYLKDKRYQEHYEVTLPNGKKVKRTRQKHEFAVNELPPLTEAEIKKLAAAQAARSSIDSPEEEI